MIMVINYMYMNRSIKYLMNEDIVLENTMNQTFLLVTIC